MEIITSIIEWVREVGVFGFLDILLVALLIYTLLVWLKTTRMAFVLKGIFIVMGIYLMARQFNLVMAASLFEKFFAAILIIIVVIFQEELKRLFEQVASLNLKRDLFGVKNKLQVAEEVEILATTLQDLARERIGALVVIQGKDIIVRHLDGGIALNGELSGPLLKSIFDPHSVGHDGAVIIEGKAIARFACHLPLSKNFDMLKEHGTRHAAGLGLSELTDALCLVVSEEYGTISVVRNGNITRIDKAKELIEILISFFEEINPQRHELFWQTLLKKNSLEKVYAVAFSALLWFVLVHGAKLTYQSFLVPVGYSSLPVAWSVKEIEPKEIEVVLKGTRADFYFMRKERIKVFLNLKLLKGQQTMPVYTHNISLPKGLVLDSFEPHEINVLLDQQ